MDVEQPTSSSVEKWKAEAMSLLQRGLKHALISTRHALVGSVVMFLVLSIPVVYNICAKLGASEFCHIYSQVAPLIEEALPDLEAEADIPTQFPAPPARISETTLQAAVPRNLACTLYTNVADDPAAVFALPSDDSDQLDEVQPGAEICYVKVVAGRTVAGSDQWLELDSGGFIHNVGFSPPAQ